MTKQSRDQNLNAIDLLTRDHKKVQKLFKDFEKLTQQDDEEGKQELAQQICAELTVHAQIEEEILYPACREVLSEQDLLDEAEVEHASAKELIEQIEAMQAGEERFDAKVTVLGEYVNHHIKEEQKELFPKLEDSDLDLEALGQELADRKEELIEEMDLEALMTPHSAMRGQSKSKQGNRRSSTSARH